MRRLLVVFAAVVNLVLIDAVTKELAAGYLKGAAAFSVVPDLFNLAYVENRGCAWGLLQGQVWPLAAFALVVLALLVWKRRTVFGATRLGAIAEPILYAGIVGNAIDRVVRGYVIDFLDFHLKAHHFPCFNLADVFITCAVAILILEEFRHYVRR